MNYINALVKGMWRAVRTMVKGIDHEPRRMSTDVQARAAQAEVTPKIRWGKPRAGSTPAARTNQRVILRSVAANALAAAS